MEREGFLSLENRARVALEGISSPDLRGMYFSLKDMSPQFQASLVEKGLLFSSYDEALESAGCFSFYPDGRGVFLSSNELFCVWCGEEDHLRIASFERGSGVGKALSRLKVGLEQLTRAFGADGFVRSNRLGWLTSCPTNLGSTIRASVHISLPRTGSRDDFIEMCESLGLQVRGIRGEGGDLAGTTFDISNKQRFGITGFDAVRQMYQGVQKLIYMERNDGALPNPARSI